MAIGTLPSRRYIMVSKPVLGFKLPSGTEVTVRANDGHFDTTKPEQAQPREIDESRHPWRRKEG